jgi:hypothetical protein
MLPNPRSDIPTAFFLLRSMCGERAALNFRRHISNTSIRHAQKFEDACVATLDFLIDRYTYSFFVAELFELIMGPVH